MSHWGWVAFAYAVAYATVGGYVLILGRRLRRTRRRLEVGQ